MKVPNPQWYVKDIAKTKGVHREMEFKSNNYSELTVINVADIWKEVCGTRGGLVRRWKQSIKPVVTTNDEKSAEVIVPRRLQTQWEGLNYRRHRQREMGKKYLQYVRRWVNYCKLANMKKPAADKVYGALLIKFSEKLRKHFNQFFLPCLYCVIICYRFFFPLFLPL